jgi:hypothetical protein
MNHINVWGSAQLGWRRPLFKGSQFISNANFNSFKFLKEVELREQENVALYLQVQRSIEIPP